jgi:hypothetical protein
VGTIYIPKKFPFKKEKRKKSLCLFAQLPTACRFAPRVFFICLFIYFPIFYIEKLMKVPLPPNSKISRIYTSKTNLEKFQDLGNFPKLRNFSQIFTNFLLKLDE